MVEIKWEDTEKKPGIVITHRITGYQAAILKTMLELQFLHKVEDITFCSHDQSCFGFESTNYHLTRKQARKLWEILDGIKYDEFITYVSYGTRM